MEHSYRQLFASYLFIALINIPLLSSSQPSAVQKVDEAYDLLDNGKSAEAYALINQVYPQLTDEDQFHQAKAYLLLQSKMWSERSFDSALVLGQMALDQFSALNETQWAAKAKLRLSRNHLALGNFDQSIAQAQGAADLFKSIGDTIQWGQAISALSNINHDIFEFQKGIAYGHQAYDLLTACSVENADAIAYALNCIAINHDDNGEHQKAIDYHMQVMPLMPRMSDHSKPRTFNNIGNSMMKMGRYGEAIGWLKKNLELVEKNGNKYGLATVKTNLGTLSYLNQEFQNSKKYLDEAEALAFEIKDVEKIHDVLYQQYMLYKTWGRFDESLEFMEKFHFFKDSLLTETKTKQLAELQTKYETEKKEQQIAIQQAEIAEHLAQNQRNIAAIIGLIIIVALLILAVILNRSRANKKQALILQEAETKLREMEIEAAISSQEKERSRFAKDLHDGFGQMISILNLNLRSLEKGERDKHEVFESSSKVLDDMYQELKGICFNLMPQTLIKHGIIASLYEFAARINQTNQITIETDFFGIDDRLTELQEISLYRITQEWVNNILKYSDARCVTIQITKDDEEITLMIEDDGSGFDAESLKSGKGNGWRNMNARANLIRGVLELDTTVGMRGNTLIVNAQVEKIPEIVQSIPS